MRTFEKGPNEVLDFTFDWSDWLEGASLDSYTVTVDSGITKVSDAKTGDTVRVLLSGGTVGAEYDIACQIVSGARQPKRKIVVAVVDR